MTVDISTLVKQMLDQQTYDEAWLAGLEIQSTVDHNIAITIFQTVLKENVSHVRRAAAFWLTDDAEHVPPELLLEMASDEDSEIRFHAAYCLGYATHEQTVSVLRRLLREDKSEDVRQTAAQSIFAASRLNMTLHVDGDILDDFAYILKHDHSATVREEVAISMASFLKSTEVSRAIELLEIALKDSNDLVREQANISISVLRDEVWHHNDTVLHPEEL